MKKVFISIPMNGKTARELDITWRRATSQIQKWLDEPISVIESRIHAEPDEGANTSMWYLAESLKLMSQADVAYFADGWEKARGCKIEYRVAEDYGLPIVTYFDAVSKLYAEEENNGK